MPQARFEPSITVFGLQKTAHTRDGAASAVQEKTVLTGVPAACSFCLYMFCLLSAITNFPFTIREELQIDRGPIIESPDAGGGAECCCGALVTRPGTRHSLCSVVL
jgi:hypothetical protein